MNYKDFYCNLHERYAGSENLRGIWYHGTSTKYLKSILSQGLVPYPKEKSWDVDPDASSVTLDRTTYGGVYVTKNLLSSFSAAYRTATKTKGNRLIVIMDIQSKSLIADEDDLSNKFVHYNQTLALWAYKIIKYGSEYPEYISYIKEKRKSFAEGMLVDLKSYFYINNPRLETILKKLIETEGYEAMVTRIAAYLNMDNYYDVEMWRRNWGYKEKEKIKHIPNPPSKSEGERIFRSFIDKLTRLLKFIPRIDTFSTKGRSLEPIRFSGSNKIICIVELVSQPNYSDKIKIHYGKLPDDFVKQYKERVNSEFDDSFLIT